MKSTISSKHVDIVIRYNIIRTHSKVKFVKNEVNDVTQLNSSPVTTSERTTQTHKVAIAIYEASMNEWTNSWREMMSNSKANVAKHHLGEHITLVLLFFAKSFTCWIVSLSLSCAFAFTKRCIRRSLRVVYVCGKASLCVTLAREEVTPRSVRTFSQSGEKKPAWVGCLAMCAPSNTT